MAAKPRSNVINIGRSSILVDRKQKEISASLQEQPIFLEVWYLGLRYLSYTAWFESVVICPSDDNIVIRHIWTKILGRIQRCA